MEADNSITSAPQQQQLPTAVQLHILSFLSPNDKALSGRLTCRDACDTLAEAHHCTASLSQPLPPHAVPCALAAGEQHVRQLPFKHKLQLLCTASVSGSETNLEVALALLQPSVFPELLQQYDKAWELVRPYDPGVAAVGAGHPQLLGWLLRRCPGLLLADDVLDAAARHCDLTGLQVAWSVLQHGEPGSSSCGRRSGDSSSPSLGQGVLDAAAESPMPDAMAKMDWVLAAGEASLLESTAVAAARLGDLRRLQWLQDRGCPVGGCRVLACALEHADLAVAQWLVDEAGCGLPGAGDDGASWDGLLKASAKGPDGVSKLRWLAERGAPPLDSSSSSSKLLCGLAVTAVEAGQVEVLRYLQLLAGSGTGHAEAELHAALREAVPRDVPMALHLQQECGCVLTGNAYVRAAATRNVGMIRWLACQAGVSAVDVSYWDSFTLLSEWDDRTPAESRERLEALQLLFGAGWRGWEVRSALLFAAERGDMAMLQYLEQQQQQQEQPAPDRQFYEGLMLAAAKCGNAALLEWLMQRPAFLAALHRCAPYAIVAQSCDLGTLVALRRLGVPWGMDDLVAVAAYNGDTAVAALRWLAAGRASGE